MSPFARLARSIGWGVAAFLFATFFFQVPFVYDNTIKLFEGPIITFMQGQGGLSRAEARESTVGLAALLVAVIVAIREWGETKGTSPEAEGRA